MEISGAIRQAVSLPNAAQPARPDPGPSAATQPPSPPVNRELGPPDEVAGHLVESLVSEAAANTRSGAKIRVDASTERVVVQILNSEDEVIKQFPPEEVLRAIAAFREVTGIIFDQQG